MNTLSGDRSSQGGLCFFTYLTTFSQPLKICLPRRDSNVVVLAVLLSCLSGMASAEMIPGRNTNTIGPPVANSGALADPGLRQQNEPSCAVNPDNPKRICCGFNDYRGIDVEGLGDAWEGMACSTDGGASWNSQLIPGHHLDPEYNLGLAFAADPNLVSVPGGLVFNYIAADRDQIGGIYVQRYIWLNKEDGWPVEAVGGPVLVHKGTSGRFIDKPHAHGFLYDNDATVSWNWNNAEGPQSRELPAGSLGVSAAVFVGNDNNDGTKILYWRSEDWGATWEQPTKLTESNGVNSGINLAAKNSQELCAIWRRFDDTNETSSVQFACSTNGGGSFSKPKSVQEDICPFDQTTLNGEAPLTDIISFRSNAFPVLASDGTHFYAFWADRGYATASNGAAGCELVVPDPATGEDSFNPSFSRIVYSSSSNGKTWSIPVPIEDFDGAASPGQVMPFAGHQFMPGAFGANGEVVLAWIDTREDLTNRWRTPGFDPAIDKQLIVDLWGKSEGAEQSVGLYRHSADVRSIKLKNGSVQGGSVKVSNYAKGLTAQGLTQLEYNLVNARLFQQGTAPFIGDYINVTALAYHQDSNGKWKNSHTAQLEGSPVFHVSWGDNRDVRGNAWGNGDANGGGYTEGSPYSPASQASDGAYQPEEPTSNANPAVQDPPDPAPAACTPGDPGNPASFAQTDRTRDQNVYSAPLYPTLTMSSPGAIKLSGTGANGEPLKRAIPIVVENHGSTKRDVQLLIGAAPAGTVASFKQFVDSVQTLNVTVYGRSSAVRTVFIASATPDLSTAIPVTATCLNGDTCAARVTLNEEPLALQQPDYGDSSVLAQETHDPVILNPSLLNPDVVRLLVKDPSLVGVLKLAGLLPDSFSLLDLFNPSLVDADTLALLQAEPGLLDPASIDPAILTLLLENPQLLNRRLLLLDPANPNILNPNLLNPNLLNPDLLNLVIANPDLLNPNLLNPNLLNNLVENPNLLNPDLLNLILDNPNLLNPNLLNILVENPNLLNPDLLNPNLLNIVVSNPNLLNSSVYDGLVELANDQDFPADDQVQYVVDNYAANTDLVNAVVANPNLLNPNLLNPNLLNPNLLNPNLLNTLVANPNLLNPNLLNPNLLNPNLLNPNLLNPNLLNPDLLNPDLLNTVLLNPNLLNQVVANPNLLNPNLLNPNLLNPNLLNPNLLNPNLLNPNLLNPNLLNPNLLNPNLLNAPLDSYSSLENSEAVDAPAGVTAGTDYYIDVTYQVQNTGNTTTGYQAQPYIVGADEPGGTEGITGTQFIVSKPYLRQTVVNCDPVLQTYNKVLVNIPNPPVTSPIINPDPSDPAVEALGSFWLAPGEVANATVRVFGAPEALISGHVGLYINSEACTTGVGVGDCNTALPFAIVERDNTGPVFDLSNFPPPELAAGIEANLPYGATVTYSEPTATDEGDGGPVPVSCDFASDSVFPLGESTHTCTATDSAGNQTVIEFTVYIEDLLAPVLTLIPPGGVAPTLEATSPDGATMSFDGWEISAEDPFGVDPFPSIDCTISNDGETSPVDIAAPLDLGYGENVLACTSTDAYYSSTDPEWETGGNTSDPVEVIINVVDTTPPLLTAPADPPAAEAQSASGAIVDYGEVFAEDIRLGQVAASCAPASGSVFPIGTTTVSCTATDGINTSAPVLFSVSVVDTTPPVVSYPSDPENIPTAEAVDASGAAVAFTVSATDFGNPLPANAVSCTTDSGSVMSGDVFMLGSTTVTCTATDGQGVQTVVSFNVLVEDTTPPALSVTAPAPAEATGPDGADVSFTASAVDSVAGVVPVTCTPASGSRFAVGTTAVSCSASDGTNSSNTVFDVVVTDTTAPQVTVPDSPLTLEATASTGAIATFAATATDIVDGDIPAESVICTPASGTEFALGETEVSCSAADTAASPNTGSNTFIVLVEDTTAPVLSVPQATVTAEASGPGGAIVNFSVSAVDIVDGSLGGNLCDYASGDQFPLDTTTVTCGVTDAAGNVSAVQTFDVEVSDNTAPELTLPAAIEVDTVTANASVNYSVTATDAVDAAVDVSCAPPSGSSFPLGASVVNCTATDDSGNSSDGSFGVTVRDTGNPVLLVPADITQEAGSPNGNNVGFTVSASDLGVDLSASVSCDSNSGDLFAIGMTAVNCSVSDLSGNTSVAGFTITVQDTTPPVLGPMPDDISVTATDSSGMVVDYTAPTATDVASLSVDVECLPESGSLFPTGTTTVICTATDAQANTSSGSFQVTVNNVPIVWISPIDTGQPHQDYIGPTLILAWGYGTADNLLNSRSFLDKPGGKGTEPLSMNYLGDNCQSGDQEIAVDLDAGSSSLRYSQGEWQLNWQTGQSELDIDGDGAGDSALLPGCYKLIIPRVTGDVDDRLFILN
jgi:hypothetical protein